MPVWNNVSIPDFSNLVRAQNNSSHYLGNAFRNIGDALSQIEANRVKQADAEVTKQALANIDNIDNYKNFLATAALTNPKASASTLLNLSTNVLNDVMQNKITSNKLENQENLKIFNKAMSPYILALKEAQNSGDINKFKEAQNNYNNAYKAFRESNPNVTLDPDKIFVGNLLGMRQNLANLAATNAGINATNARAALAQQQYNQNEYKFDKEKALQAAKEALILYKLNASNSENNLDKASKFINMFNKLPDGAKPYFYELGLSNNLINPAYLPKTENLDYINSDDTKNVNVNTLITQLEAQNREYSNEINKKMRDFFGNDNVNPSLALDYSNTKLTSVSDVVNTFANIVSKEYGINKEDIDIENLAYDVNNIKRAVPDASLNTILQAMLGSISFSTWYSMKDFSDDYRVDRNTAKNVTNKLLKNRDVIASLNKERNAISASIATNDQYLQKAKELSSMLTEIGIALNSKNLSMAEKNYYNTLAKSIYGQLNKINKEAGFVNK